MARILVILVCNGLIIGIAMYGLDSPPVKETALSAWMDTAAEGESAVFQHSSLDVLLTMHGNKVRLKDRYGVELVCNASPSLELHPALHLPQRINARLVKKDDVCYVVRSVVGSCHRRVKMVISAATLMVVFVVFLRRYRFVRSEMAFVKRGRDA